MSIIKGYLIRRNLYLYTYKHLYSNEMYWRVIVIRYCINTLKLTYMYIYTNIQFVPRSKHTPVDYENQSMLCREKISVCELNVYFLISQLVVHDVTTGIRGLKYQLYTFDKNESWERVTVHLTSLNTS